MDKALGGAPTLIALQAMNRVAIIPLLKETLQIVREAAPKSVKDGVDSKPYLLENIKISNKIFEVFDDG